MKTEALYYRQGPKAFITCELCPHGCHILPGQKGLCGVRRHEDGKLLADSYGQVAAIALDPIEKKPLARFLPNSTILSIGFYGCNMSCPYCQNAGLAKGSGPTRPYHPEALAKEAERLRSMGNVGIAYTYNEPTVAYEMVLDTARAVHERGLKNVLVSNGLINPAPFAELLPELDALNIDLKSYDPEFYRKVLRGDFQTTWQSLIASLEAGKHLEITYLVLAGHNDDPDAFDSLCARIANELSPEIPLHLTRSFPRYRWEDLKVTPKAAMEELAAIASQHLSDVLLGAL